MEIAVIDRGETEAQWVDLSGNYYDLVETPLSGYLATEKPTVEDDSAADYAASQGWTLVEGY